jgi:clathrin heavy chain
MHWNKQVIALKANQRTLQVFDLAQKTKLQSATMNEDVLFWKWFSTNSLGLVTDTAVYHWSVFDGIQTSPIKVFERHQILAVGPSCWFALSRPAHSFLGVSNH